MSLNKYEQRLFDYLERNPEERRHWQSKVQALALQLIDAGTASRALERELWEYFVERSEHVPQLRELNTGGLRRVSLLNLSEHLMRMFAPVTRRAGPRSPDRAAGPRID
jgi:hypothetical protein